MKTLDDLQGKVALVTGSTEGLGLRIAENLARRGARVVLNGRNTTKGAHAVDELQRATGSEVASFVAGDCADHDAATQVAQRAAQGGAIDILVSCGATGAVRPMPFAEMSGREIFDSFNSRFFARINPVHAALPYLRQRGGAVVLMGTDAARHPTPGESMVGAFGAGVILLTKALAREFARWNIRVNGLALTITSETASYSRVFSEQTFQTRLFEKALGKFPSGRPPNATEVANVATFLATDDSAQVTGQTISVNGGLSFGGW
ncbi:SDR family oxidoreductase [Ramlibacter sp. AN1015]|uniref:SDR family NAD(P)-dependent oxidoreductase n=1 Tax=Ramlibacter sp. AN1015 TaxID=3133428 RepID=UPI0030C2198D